MFRLNQIQILPQTVEGILSRFNSDDTVRTISNTHDLPQSQTMEVTFSYAKRRRRARRLTGPVGTNLRSTWY